MARNVLVDTSAIYAFVSSGDRFHTQSREIYSELLDRGDLLYTTSYVLESQPATIVLHQANSEVVEGLLGQVGLLDVQPQGVVPEQVEL